MGDHQLNNAAVAIKTAELLQAKQFIISDETIKMGLKITKWPGRMEQIHNKPIVFLDGAHNLEGMRVLVDSAQKFEGVPVKVLFTAMKDKEFVE